jgi:hypothetical protein
MCGFFMPAGLPFYQRLLECRMKHHIDPKIDCVFKALLGAEDNRNLLVHFLNAILW